MMEKQQIIKHLENFPLYSQDGKGYDAQVKIIFSLLGTRNKWYITEGSERDNDFIMFGYVQLLTGELGYISLNELLNLDMGVLSVEFINDDLKLSDIIENHA